MSPSSSSFASPCKTRAAEGDPPGLLLYNVANRFTVELNDIMLQKGVGYICSPSHTSKTLVGMGIVEL